MLYFDSVSKKLLPLAEGVLSSADCSYAFDPDPDLGAADVELLRGVLDRGGAEISDLVYGAGALIAVPERLRSNFVAVPDPLEIVSLDSDSESPVEKFGFDPELVFDDLNVVLVLPSTSLRGDRSVEIRRSNREGCTSPWGVVFKRGFWSPKVCRFESEAEAVALAEKYLTNRRLDPFAN